MDISRPVIGAAGRAGDLDALAAQCLEEFGRGGVVGHAQRKRFQLLGERRGGVVVDAGNAAAALVEHGERLQHVVQLRRSEVDGHALVAGDGAGVLEVADAVFVEDDLADGQVFDGAWSRALRGGCWFGCGMCGSLGGERNGYSSTQNDAKCKAILPPWARQYRPPIDERQGT